MDDPLPDCQAGRGIEHGGAAGGRCLARRGFPAGNDLCQYGIGADGILVRQGDLRNAEPLSRGTAGFVIAGSPVVSGNDLVSRADQSCDDGQAFHYLRAKLAQQAVVAGDQRFLVQDVNDGPAALFFSRPAQPGRQRLRAEAMGRKLPLSQAGEKVLVAGGLPVEAALDSVIAFTVLRDQTGWVGEVVQFDGWRLYKTAPLRHGYGDNSGHLSSQGSEDIHPGLVVGDSDALAWRYRIAGRDVRRRGRAATRRQRHEEALRARRNFNCPIDGRSLLVWKLYPASEHAVPPENHSRMVAYRRPRIQRA